MELKIRYTPITTDKVIYHKDLADKMFSILNNPNHSNIILYGIKSSGKNVLLNCCLNTIYKEHYPYTKVTKTPNILYKYSNIHYHFYFNLKNRLDDIVKLLYDIINTRKTYVDIPYTIIIFDNFHNVNDIIQNSIRKIIENPWIKTIIITKTISKVIKPIRSRCILFNVTNNKYDLIKFVNHVNKCENKIVPEQIIDDLCDNSNINNVLEDLEIYYKTGKLYDNIYIDIHNNILSILCKNKLTISDIEFIKTSSHNILIMNNDIIYYLKNFMYHIFHLTDEQNNGTIVFKHNNPKKSNSLFLNNIKKYKIIKLFSKIDCLLLKSYRKIIHIENLLLNLHQIINE